MAQQAMPQQAWQWHTDPQHCLSHPPVSPVATLRLRLPEPVHHHSRGQPGARAAAQVTTGNFLPGSPLLPPLMTAPVSTSNFLPGSPLLLPLMTAPVSTSTLPPGIPLLPPLMLPTAGASCRLVQLRPRCRCRRCARSHLCVASGVVIAGQGQIQLQVIWAAAGLQQEQEGSVWRPPFPAVTFRKQQTKEGHCWGTHLDTHVAGGDAAAARGCIQQLPWVAPAAPLLMCASMNPGSMPKSLHAIGGRASEGTVLGSALLLALVNGFVELRWGGAAIFVACWL